MYLPKRQIGHHEIQAKMQKMKVQAWNKSPCGPCPRSVFICQVLKEPNESAVVFKSNSTPAMMASLPLKLEGGMPFSVKI